MCRRSTELRVPAVAWLSSVAVHFALSVLGARLAAEQTLCRAASGLVPRFSTELGLVAVELEASDRSGITRTPSRALLLPEVPVWDDSSGQLEAHPDTTKAGRGGDRTARIPAVNLASENDDLSQTVVLRTHLDQDQVFRRGSGSERSSRENARLVDGPMELVLVGMGGDQAAERLSQDRMDGTAVRPTATEPTLQLGAPEAIVGIDDRQAEPLGAASGEENNAQPYGIEVHYQPWSAEGQPQALTGNPSAPATERGPEQDNAHSAQQAHGLRPRSTLVSTAGGLRGTGRGGSSGGGRAGTGGLSGAGFRSGPLGERYGPYRGLGAADPSRRSYLRMVAAKIQPLWASAFPRREALAGKQGTVIVGFVIAADGSIAGAWISRPSGVGEFDENCRRAVMRAAPFGPLPPELRPQLRVTIPFEFKNPAVRPPAPGDQG